MIHHNILLCICGSMYLVPRQGSVLINQSSLFHQVLMVLKRVAICAFTTSEHLVSISNPFLCQLDLLQQYRFVGCSTFSNSEPIYFTMKSQDTVNIQQRTELRKALCLIYFHHRIKIVWFLSFFPINTTLLDYAYIMQNYVKLINHHFGRSLKFFTTALFSFIIPCYEKNEQKHSAEFYLLNYYVLINIYTHSNNIE